MSQHDSLQLVMQDSTEQLAGIFIGKVSSVPQNSLFEIIGIRSYLQHLHIMIRFQQQGIHSLQALHGVIIIDS